MTERYVSLQGDFCSERAYHAPRFFPMTKTRPKNANFVPHIARRQPHVLQTHRTLDNAN